MRQSSSNDRTNRLRNLIETLDDDDSKRDKAYHFRDDKGVICA
jgi:hypothetical protein